MSYALPKLDKPPVVESAGEVELARWKREALGKLAELAALPENWDSYGSPAVQPLARQRAADLLDLLGQFKLPAPQIFPVPGGGLQLEWQKAGGGMELEILPDGSLEFLIEDADGQMREGGLAFSREDLARMSLWFTRSQARVVEF